MHVLHCQGVNDAYIQGLRYLRQVGVEQDSRAGRVLVAPTPVTTVYSKPWERVLFDPKRDANPVFHVFEALWMLSGRRDATWLDRFVSDFSKRFAEDDGNQHGAYGYRWRKHFDLEWSGHDVLPDQLDVAVRLLKENHDERRAVIQMWDPCSDLDVKKKDVPCNLNICLRVRSEIETVGMSYANGMGGAHQELVPYLDMMVTCRSNDAIYGCYGANAVHFSMLLEYLAGRIGVKVGTYSQVSFNFHAYLDVLAKVGEQLLEPPTYPGTHPMGNDWGHWDDDLETFMAWADGRPAGSVVFRNSWFETTAVPLLLAHERWKLGERKRAVRTLIEADTMAPDWRQGAWDWMDRRMAKLKTA